ncbi:MAG: hypothetical protein E4H08_09685, partial [Candidatus Atribacteria bacterium]
MARKRWTGQRASLSAAIAVLVALCVTAIAAHGAPTITSSQAGITVDLGSTPVSSAGLGTTFSITGTDLTPASGELTVTGAPMPSNIEVSSDGTTWGSSYTIAYTGGALVATDVHVRLGLVGLPGPCSTDVVVSGGGATSIDQAVEGIRTYFPTYSSGQYLITPQPPCSPNTLIEFSIEDLKDQWGADYISPFFICIMITGDNDFLRESGMLNYGSDPEFPYLALYETSFASTGNYTARFYVDSSEARSILGFSIMDVDSPGLTSFTRQTPPTSPTNADTLIFRVTFDEDVENVNAADFDVTGTTATITDVNPVSASVYDVTISAGDLASLNGTVGLSLAGGQNIADLASNPLPAGDPGTDETYTVDNASPNVTINQAGGQADPTNASPVVFTAVFDEPIDDVTFTDVDVTVGGTAMAGLGLGGVTVMEIAPNDDTTFSVSIVVTGDGTVIPAIPAGAAEDLAGNTNTASTSTDNEVTYDVTPPTISIGAPSVSVASMGPVTYIVSYGGADVVTLAAGDIMLNKTGTANGTVGVSGSGATARTVTISGIAGDGTLGIYVANAGTGMDDAGNSTPEAGPSATVFVDNTAPTDPTLSSTSHTVDVWSNNASVVIAAAGADDGAGSGVDGFEIKWDQSASWTPTETKEQEESWSGATFAATSDGDWYFHIATVDNAGNWTSTQHLGPFQIDTTPPSIPTGLDPANGSYTTDTSPILSWSASTDTGGSGMRTTAAYRVVVEGPVERATYVSDTDYKPTLSEEGTFTWKVCARDNAGNSSSYSANTTLIIDATQPGVMISQPVGQSDPTNVSPVVFTAAFDEGINLATLEASDVVIGGSATTGAVSIGWVAATTYFLSVPVTSDGTVIATLPADSVEDNAGNINTASTSTDNTVTYDGTKPNVTIDQAAAQVDPTNANPVVFTVEFNEPVNDSTFTNADVNVGGTATTVAVTVTEVSPNDDTTFEITIVVTVDGTVTPTIPAGGVEDLAGNTNTASTSTDNSVTLDSTKPHVTISQGGSQSDPTNTSPVIFAAKFDEPINPASFTTVDVSVGGTAATGTITVTEIAPNDDTTFEISVVVTSDGTVVPTIPAGGVEDVAGNTNTVSTSTDNTITLETVKPDVTINQAGGQSDPTNASPVLFTAVFDEPINDATFTDADVTIGGTATTGAVTVTEIAPNDDTTFSVSVVMTGDGTV